MPDEKDDSNKKNAEDMPVELESQFILRLPPTPAASLRAALRSGVMNIKDRLNIQLEPDTRQGVVKFDKWVLPAKLLDLPCIIESHKTLDRKTFYKTADIGQMVHCKEEDDPTLQIEEEESTKKKDNKKDNKVDKKFLYPHGITAPLKNVRKRRFRKTLKKKYVDFPEIEKEVKRLFRMDNEAINVRYEVLNAEDEKLEQKPGMSDFASGSNGMLNNNSQGMDVGEHDIFGEVVSSSEEDDNILNLGYDDTSQSVDNCNLGEKSEDKSFVFSKALLDNDTEYSLNDPNQSFSVEHSSDPIDVKEEPYLVKEKEKSMLDRLDLLEQEISALKTQRRTQELEILNIENQALKQRFQTIIENLKTKEEEYRQEYDEILSVLQQ